MTITTVLAYLLIACYFIVERRLRKGEKALSLNVGEFDRGSSKILLISGLCSILLLLFAPRLNTYQLGVWHSTSVRWAGLLLMVCGLALRYWAAKTLGEFYTRTLLTVDGQPIVEQGPYRMIRHPGYLGTFLLEIGAGLAIANWVVLSLIIILGVLARAYRIRVEEDMLKTMFGEEYRVYSNKTWRFIPCIY